MTEHDDVLAGSTREIRTDSGAERTVLIRRRYDAAAEDVWEACTDPERLSRFFMRPAGDLREGGRYHFEGNASGTILRCEPPRRLRLTWEYGEGPGSEVELRLAPDRDGGTVLELEHAPVSNTVEMGGRLLDPVLNDPETGTWGLGTGWDLGLYALGAYLAGDLPDGVAAELEMTAEVLALADRFGAAWAEVVRAADARARS
jgi:uncharacterized protein YndB with AHSA1/START domain